MWPIVRIVGDGDTCRPLGAGQFSLRATDGHYRLPRLSVTDAAPDGSPVTEPAMRIGDIEATSHELETAVRETWTATSSLPVALVQPPQIVRVTWRVGAGCGDDQPDAERWEIQVTLKFEPVRDRVHPGFVAIDFGMSNSTVTLFDQGQLGVRALAESQVERLRTRLIEVISGDSVPPVSTDQFLRLLAWVSRAALGTTRPVGRDGPEPDHRNLLLDALRGESLRDPKRLYAVLLGLERERPARAEPLRGWLTQQLYRCYDDTFATPGLDMLRLFPVELDRATGGTELPSRVRVITADPLVVRLQPDNAVEDGSQATRVHLGLKQYLGRPEKRMVADETAKTAEVDTDQLIQAALSDLVRRSEAFAASRPDRLRSGHFDHAVITYPTIAPPSIRKRLRELLTAPPPEGPGIRLVETHYDEAIAAAMFFLMRDFGGDFEVGVEAVKARYRPVADDAWTQNVLVMDIGGGTTDIALLTMTLQDETPALPDPDPRWLGRYYTVTPTVRGTTGHLQLGGEYLTLLVFRWLKATLADRLLTSEPGSFPSQLQSLPKLLKDGSGGYRTGSAVTAVLNPGPPDEEVPNLVESVLPTRWAEEPAREQAFWLLWRLAERAKLALGDPDGAAETPFRVPARELTQVLHAVRTMPEEAVSKLSEWDLELTRDIFESIVNPPLRDVMQLATDLVVHRFNATDPGQKLDRIILTGKTSGLTQVREALNTHFGSGNRVNWSPTGVTVEKDFPKLVTSIGACWAESIRQLALENPTGADARLREGRTVLRTKIENLFFTLPCTFSRLEQEGYSTLIPVGEDLYQLDEQPIGKVRSLDWVPLTRTFTVYRMASENGGPSWGTFSFELHAADPDDTFEPNEGVWLNEVKVQLEATQDLDLNLHLCRGEPHYVVTGPAISLLDEELPVSWPTTDDGLLTSLPGDIVVNVLNAGSGERGWDVVFEHDGEDPSADGSRFTEVFVESNEPDAPWVMGRISSEALRDPAGSKSGAGWTFYLLAPDGDLQLIGELPRPVLGDGQFPTRYRATLDATGRLRVHAGALPYRRARSRRDVEAHEGHVLTLPLPPDEPKRDETRNPFNGTH